MVEETVKNKRPMGEYLAAEREKFLTAAAVYPVLLVDTPPERKGSKIQLEYLLEGDRMAEESTPGIKGTEASKVWSVLHESFQESIGKVRVFSDPDHVGFIAAYLTRGEVKNDLIRAIRVEPRRRTSRQTVVV